VRKFDRTAKRRIFAGGLSEPLTRGPSQHRVYQTRSASIASFGEHDRSVDGGVGRDTVEEGDLKQPDSQYLTYAQVEPGEWTIEISGERVV